MDVCFCEVDRDAAPVSAWCEPCQREVECERLAEKVAEHVASHAGTRCALRKRMGAAVTS